MRVFALSLPDLSKSLLQGFLNRLQKESGLPLFFTNIDHTLPVSLLLVVDYAVIPEWRPLVANDCRVISHLMPQVPAEAVLT
jgi:hypothetical protein